MTNTNDKPAFPTLTYAILRDYISRARSVITESDSADEHTELTDELTDAMLQLTGCPGFTSNDVANANFVREVREILVDRAECWREELSGADVIEQLTAALDAYDFGATMTRCERPDCEQLVGRNGDSVCGQCLEEDQTEPRVIFADGGRSHAEHCPCWDCHPENDPDRPPAGWSVYHTGGGCHCWQKEFPSGAFIWLTESGDAQPPSDPAKPVSVGLYADDGVCMGMLEATSLTHALSLAESVAMIADKTTGQHDGQPHDDGSFHDDPHCTCNTCMAAHAKAQDKTAAEIESAIRENVIAALARFNVTATHEYPGFLAVQFNGRVYDFGTADGERWGGNSADGRTAVPMPAIPADCDDAAVIAQGILVALLQPVQR